MKRILPAAALALAATASLPFSISEKSLRLFNKPKIAKTVTGDKRGAAVYCGMRISDCGFKNEAIVFQSAFSIQHSAIPLPARARQRAGAALPHTANNSSETAFSSAKN